MIAVDTETTGLGFFDEAFGASVYDGSTSRWFELPEEQEALVYTLSGSTCWVFHNAKFDLHKLLNLGVVSREALQSLTIHDTECLAHMLDANRSKALKTLTRELLGVETDEEEVLKAARKKAKLKKEDGYYLLPREVVVPYALKDVEYTYALFERLYPQVGKWPELLGLYEHEQALMLVLLDMERRGMAVDVEYLDTTTREYATKILMRELSIRDETSEDFNPNSWQQLQAVFAERGTEIAGTSRDILEALDDPLASAILEYRKLKKIHGTYLKAIQAEQRDGLMHPWFRQHGTRTGRMSSGGATE